MLQCPRSFLAQPTFEFIPSKPKANDIFDDPVRCVYATKRTGVYNMKVYQVHEMKFFPDFFKEVSSFGHLPKVSLEEVKKLEREIKPIKEHNQDLKDLQAYIKSLT